MKAIGLAISIGASVMGAVSGIKKVNSSTAILGEKLKSLNSKKLNIIANDSSVKKLSDKFGRLEKRIDVLKKKRIELQAKIATAKSQEEIDKLKLKINQTSRRITAMNNNKFKLKDQLKEARVEAESTNKSVLKIASTIKKINSTKLKIQQTVERRENFKQNAVGHATKVAALAMPIKTGIEFESSMARVKAITMATDTQFKALEKTALKLGSSTTFTSSQVAEGMQYLSMAGFKTNQTIKAMPGVLNLASAGAVDLATTSDIASNVLSGFKIKAEKMGMVADVMAKAITTANIDVQSIGETMKYAATPAQSLGDSIQTVTALTGKLGDIGIKGSEAGTALRSMYLRMASPPKEAQKVIKKLGISVKDSKGNFVGMVNVLQQLNRKTKGMGNTVKSDYMKKLFGTEAVSAAIALTDKADGTLKKYVKTLEDSSGFSQKMADIQNATTAGALKRLSSAIEGISIKFSKMFTPAINVVATALSKVGTAIGSAMDKYPRLTKYLAIGIASFLTTGIVVGGLAITLGFAANGFRLLRLRMLTSTIATTTATIATKAYGLALSSIKFGWFIVKTVALKGALIAKTVALGTATIATKAYGVASTLAVGGLKMLGRTIAFVGRAMLMNPIGLAVTAIAGTAYLLYEYWEPISGFFSSLWSGVKSVFSGAWEGIKTIFNWSPLGIVMNNWQSILVFFNGIGTGIKNFFLMGWNAIKTALAWNPLNIVMGTWNSLTNFFSNFSLKDAGAKIITSVVDGFNSKIEYLKGKVASITQTIREYWPFSPAKRGALRDIHKIKLLETVASGLNEKPLLNAVNKSTQKVRKALAVGGVGMAIGGSLAVAQPMSPTSVSETYQVRELLTKEKLLTSKLPTLKDRSFNTLENLKLSNINPIQDRTFQTKEILDSTNSLKSNTENKSTNITINFGDTHIYNDTDKEEFFKEIERRVQNAIRDEKREKNSIGMYDVGNDW